MTKEKDFNYYLQLDGGIIFNVAIYNRFSSIGDSCYADICGGFIEGVYQWADHNIKPTDFKHAKNLFSKYLLEDVKFNNSEEANIYANLY